MLPEGLQESRAPHTQVRSHNPQVKTWDGPWNVLSSFSLSHSGTNCPYEFLEFFFFLASTFLSLLPNSEMFFLVFCPIQVYLKRCCGVDPLRGLYFFHSSILANVDLQQFVCSLNSSIFFNLDL